MHRYWISEPIARETLSTGGMRYGCYVFETGRKMAICEAMAESAEEALGLGRALRAALDRPFPYDKQADIYQRVAASMQETEAMAMGKAAHAVLSAPRADTDLLDEWDRYYDACQQMNRVPLSYDEWKAARHD